MDYVSFPTRWCSHSLSTGILAHFLLCCAFYCTFRYSPMTCSTFLFEDSLHDVTRFSIQFSKVTTKEAKKPIGAERMTGRHVRQELQPIKSLFLCHMCVILLFNNHRGANYKQEVLSEGYQVHTHIKYAAGVQERN